MTYRMYVKTQVPGLRRAAVHLGVDEQGEVQQLLTREVLQRLPAYMPRKTGALAAGTHQESQTLIKVDGPYARAQFFGVKRDGGQFDYDTSGNPKAGPHWDRRLVADEGASICAKVQRFVRSKE